MTVLLTAHVDHDCARCERPIPTGRRMAWLGDDDELVHPACVEDD
jgi:hypothetical protein